MNAERLIILGAGGDLTGRYLLPALAQLEAAGRLSDDFTIAAVAQDDCDPSEFRRRATENLNEHASAQPEKARKRLVERIDYLSGDATDPSSIAPAFENLSGPAVIYLALPPAVFAPTVEALAKLSLPEGTRLVVEKPFGTDLASAQELNALLHRHFDEGVIFRMDHFLGEQIVRNLLGIRFANRIFEPCWNRHHIDRVEIIWEETLALEGRAGYYDRTGALVDMIQNHLLQLLCFVAMETPERMHESELRDAKVELLRTAGCPDPAGSENGSVPPTRRARYTAGRVQDRTIPDYTDEPGVDPDNRTETFAEVTLSVDNERWKGVPFVLRTGKAMGEDRSFIRVAFRPPSQAIFDHDGRSPANELVLHSDPDRMVLDLALNGEGDPFHLESEQLDLDLGTQDLAPYARLLLDAFKGDPTLSIRGDEAEEAWRVVEPILEAWAEDRVPLEEYRAGSSA